MTADQARQSPPPELLSDQEVRRRLLANPRVRARATRLARQVRDGNRGKAAGVTAEALPDFLREHGLDPR